MKIEIRGFATASTWLENVGDVRALVKWLDQYGVDDSIGVEFEASKVWIELADGKGDMISCGDHVPPEDKYDVILLTHPHPEDNVEAKLKYDWMSVDRYGDERRPE